MSDNVKRRATRRVFSTAASMGMILAVSAAVGCNGGVLGGSGPIVPTPLASADFGSVRLRMLICELQVPAERVMELDSDRLAAGATDEKAFLDRLSKLGAAKVLYRLDQTVDLNSTSQIKAGVRKPFVTAARVTQSGRTMRTVQYERLGAVCKVTGKAVKDADPPHMRAEVNVDLSTMSDSGVKISDKVQARVLRMVTLVHAGSVQLGRPFVMVSTTPGAQGKTESAAFVCRGVFTRPN
ncbi:hypothetical protein LCGC14_1158250 [marine sediment metagenome]|uniref:Uncharacterized protein n=1 Tax=marine sediment metagenome TaxID=412755 RepID=A0A0F9MGH3_9ZZZZ